MTQNDSTSLSEITQKLSNVRVYLMGIAMLMVVLFHCRCVPFVFGGYWGVDVFILVSGFGIYYSLQKTKSFFSFYWRRFVRIMPSAVLCGMFFFLVGHPHGKVALAPFGLNLWYIRTILIFYAISPLLFHAIRRWNYKACVSLILLSETAAYASPYICAHVELLNNPIIDSTLSWSFARLPLYVVGMFLPYISEHNNLRIPMWVLFCMALIGGVLVCMCRVYQVFYHLDFVRCLFMPGSILLVPVIIYGVIVIDSCIRHCPRIFLQVLQYFGLFSLEIYLIHESVLMEVPFVKTYVLSAALAKIICIIVSLLLAWLVNRLCRMLQSLPRSARH